MKHTNEYLDGKKLYGDDFNDIEIENWFREEMEGYASLGANVKTEYNYGYNALNVRHGFNKLPNKTFKHVLGFGSAYGDELKPIAYKMGKITILEPSQSLRAQEICGISLDYKIPNSSGKIDLPDDTIDLAVCFGVLHHIPNVSEVLKEVSRVIVSNGYFLIREPIVSMGDWSKPRFGLTKNERGIPIRLLRAALHEAGFEVISERFVIFPPLARLIGMFTNKSIYNNSILTFIDDFLCRIFKWNLQYHAENNLRKIRPTSVFMVLRRKFKVTSNA